MLFTRRKDAKPEPTLRERGASVAHSVGDVVSRGAAHASTLAELFRLEAGECAGRALRKVVLLLAGLFFAVVGYILLLACGAVLLAGVIGWPWALGALCAAHLVAALAFVAAAGKRKVGPLAPETAREIKNDVQCIRILLKDGSKNS